MNGIETDLRDWGHAPAGPRPDDQGYSAIWPNDTLYQILHAWRWMVHFDGKDEDLATVAGLAGLAQSLCAVLGPARVTATRLSHDEDCLATAIWQVHVDGRVWCFETREDMAPFRWVDNALLQVIVAHVAAPVGWRVVSRNTGDTSVIVGLLPQKAVNVWGGVPAPWSVVSTDAHHAERCRRIAAASADAAIASFEHAAALARAKSHTRVVSGVIDAK